MVESVHFVRSYLNPDQVCPMVGPGFSHRSDPIFFSQDLNSDQVSLSPDLHILLTRWDLNFGAKVLKLWMDLLPDRLTSYFIRIFN